MLIGYFIVKAEPAVYVLNKQVEEVTDGAISAQAMGLALSAGVSISVGLAMVRVLTGISILWFLVPGYVFAISISFVVPQLFTAIAVDAGGVAYHRADDGSGGAAAHPQGTDGAARCGACHRVCRPAG